MPQKRWAVLVRGINLGGHNKVPMAALREALSADGFAEVMTLLQSGNVVLTSDATKSDAVASRVRAIIADEFGVDTSAVAVDLKTLSAVVDECPMLDFATEPSRLLATILSAPPTKAMLTAWDPGEIDPPNVAVGGQAIYQWCPDGVHKAPQLLPLVEKRWKLEGTARNWNTVTKLVTMLQAT